MTAKLKDKVALITGASAGIGWASAVALAEEGASLVLTARRPARLLELEEAVRAAGGQAVSLVGDAGDEDTARQAVALAEQTFGKLDILVNNVGVGIYKNLVDTSAEDYDTMMDSNMRSTFLFTRYAVPGMIARRRGGVLNVASTAAFQPGPGMAVYFATKGCVLSFGEALAEELKGRGITVTTLCPGPTRTNFGKVANFRGGDHLTRHAMSAEVVARYGHCAFRRGRVLAIPGTSNWLLTLLVRVMPRFAVRKIVKWGNTARKAER